MRKYIAFLFISMVILLSALPYGLDAQETNQAGLVIDYGGGNVEALCVDFTEPEINGYELLARSGLALEVDFAGSNGAVCSIDGTGCSASDCFCHCRGGDNCTYWTYWHRIGNEWVYSQVGAPLYPISHGDVEGWAWGLTSTSERQPPPERSFADICQAEPATNTPTSTPKPTVVIPVLPTQVPESPTVTATVAPTSTGTAIPSPTNQASPTIATTTTADEATAVVSLSPSATTDTAEPSFPSPSEATLDDTQATAEEAEIGIEPDNSASLTPDLSAGALLVNEDTAESEVSAEATVTPSLIETATAVPLAAPVQQPSDSQATATATPVVTIIGALAAMPEEEAVMQPAQANANSQTTPQQPQEPQALAPETSWLSYVVFLLICTSLVSLLIIGRLRSTTGAA